MGSPGCDWSHLVLYEKSDGGHRSSGFVSFFRINVWARFRHLFPSVSALGLVPVVMVALSKNGATSIGFFPWFFSRDDRTHFIYCVDWRDGCGILDFGLVDCAAFSRHYQLGSGSISSGDRIDCPTLAKLADPLDIMVSGLVWLGNRFYES